MTEHELKDTLHQLQNLSGETEVAEFKEAKNTYDFTKLGKYFSALSNEANLKNKPHAWLIFGIENKKHHVVGTQFRSNRKDLDSLKNEIANTTTNRITFIEIHQLNLPEGRVIMFQIPAAPKGLPIAFEGHYYGRDGESLSPLNLEELERIRKQAAHIDWSEGICAGATIGDLDLKAIKIARDKFKVKNPRLATEVDEWDNATFLNKAKITIGNQITNTAIILLGKPESEIFLSPAIAHITWVLKSKDNIERDYEHFSCPFILTMDQVFSKIRNLKYRYLKDGTLFPEEIDQYEPLNIKEALSNCIAHQDYTLRGRINVVEYEDGRLIFTNLGEFLPGSIETVIESNAPPSYYRNKFLAHAMVALNMIDTVGSGIKRMFRLQGERFFPLPDYDFSDGKVQAALTGKILDTEFVRVLAKNPGLTLAEIIMLDKVQKKKEITDEEIKHLREKRLIEGRKPNFIIGEKIAVKSDQVGAYIKNKGLDKAYYKKLILEFLKRKKEGANKPELRELLWNKLPDVLSDKQKEAKISNMLTELKSDDLIINTGTDTKPNWKAKSLGNSE